MGFRSQHHRRSIRLRGYDYRRAGAYFLTLCIREKEALLGRVVNASMQLNLFGQIVEDCWTKMPLQYPYLSLDAHIIMPNHFHGILIIKDPESESRSAPTTKPLGNLVAAFKTVSTKQINQIRQSPGLPVWQRNYYEHVIRNEKSLDQIRSYVANNPSNWQTDSLFVNEL